MNADLKFGAVVFIDGNLKGQLGYFDDFEDDEESLGIVFPGEPFKSDYIIEPIQNLRNVTSLEHEKFKRKYPEVCRLIGID